jgi:hypothetical protein
MAIHAPPPAALKTWTILLSAAYFSYPGQEFHYIFYRQEKGKTDAWGK